MTRHRRPKSRPRNRGLSSSGPAPRPQRPRSTAESSRPPWNRTPGSGLGFPGPSPGSAPASRRRRPPANTSTAPSARNGPGAAGRRRRRRLWSRFDESAWAEIYGLNFKRGWCKFTSGQFYCFLVPLKSRIVSISVKLFLSAIFAWHFICQTKMKICPKKFRPKWSFMKSIPGVSRRQ
jgi:hypothetical protein